jgi:cardiolipin synthase
MIVDWATLSAAFFVLLLFTQVTMLFVVPWNRRPASAIAWLLLIAVFPLVGLPAFFLFGSSKLPEARRAQQRQMDERISAAVRAARQDQALAPLMTPPVPAYYEPFARLTAALGRMPVFGGNHVELLVDYGGIYRRMVDDIDRAERYIHLEYFALSLDAETEPVLAALERAARRGVKVRVLMDHYGSLVYPRFRALRRRLDAGGIEHRLMLPINPFDGDFSRIDLRNHRKIVVVDGRIGYTGSQNMIRRNYYRRDDLYYDELVVRVTGPVVHQLDAVFITDWFAEAGAITPLGQFAELAADWRARGGALAQVLPSGPGHDNDNNLKLFVSLVHAARRAVVLVTPYFVPDESLMLAITSAAQRGVEVSLINSEAADQFLVYHAQQSYYDELLRAGVGLYLYQRPAVLHSKSISIDDDIAVIGSSNLDMRSFRLDLEVTLVCPDRQVVADLHRIESEYLRRSRRLTLDEWRARPLWTTLANNVARLTSALQ